MRDLQPYANPCAVTVTPVSLATSECAAELGPPVPIRSAFALQRPISPRVTEPFYHATHDYNAITYYHDATAHNDDPAARNHDGLWRAGARPRRAHAGWRVPRRVSGRAGRPLLSLRDAAPDDVLFSGPWLLVITRYRRSELAWSHSRTAGRGSRKVGGRFSYPHTPSKNPPPISGTQAYIAYLLGR